MIEIIKKEFERRLIDEGFARIKSCLHQMNEEEIWHKQNENTNSVGNLVMHLEGNVRQYVVSGIGGLKDTRKRDSEFDQNNTRPSKDIIKSLKETLEESLKTINNLTETNLIEKRKVQGFDETVLSIIIHVIEHFSYHVGQITYYLKFIKDIDTGYYSGLDLNITD